jgi:acetate kinase
MKILVLNSGSSSIKYQLFDMPKADVICSGLVERIGIDNAQIHYKTDVTAIDKSTEIPNHRKGLELIVDLLLDDEIGVLKSKDEVEAVGHRVVHGGSAFSDTTVINQKVKAHIKKLSALAPQHNPPNLEGIEVAESFFPNAKQIAVFDTAFHQTIPEVAYRYAIPNELTDKHGIRLYGFHGTSHKYVAEQTRNFVENASKMIVIHLGNGCSMTAIKDGKSIDHSLGFGPVTGLVMGTRSGDIDHALIFHLVNELGYNLDEVNALLQKQSGMLGLTGHSDLREIEEAANNGDKKCQLALEINAYRIKKYIGAYTAAMNGLDVLVFTAGIGENSSTVRDLVCRDMDYLGIDLDIDKNNIRSKNMRTISTKNSKVKVLVIPTNEEFEIAKQSYQLISE